jgi:hypothetical protein
MLWYDDTSVGVRDMETADGPAGSGAVRGRRVRELHVAGADFKGTSVRAVPWERARPREGAALGRRAARTPRRRGAHDVAAWSAVGSKSFHSALVWTWKSPKFWIEVHKVVNSKVVDLTTLYNFYKCCMVFFSAVFAQIAAKLWMPLCFGEQELLAVDQVFHPFPLKIWNAIQHESCVPRKTEQHSYWEILKCLGEIWRTRQKFRKTFADVRVSVGFDRAFDRGLTTSVCWLGQGGQ